MLNGGLFTRDFLIEGICGTNAWRDIDDADLIAMRARLEALLSAFGKIKNPTEAETEKELIWPILEAIGWTEISVQQNLSAKARDDVPDALLFGDADAKTRAAPLAAWQRFQHGLCVVEAKRWNRVLDREEKRRKGRRAVNLVSAAYGLTPDEVALMWRTAPPRMPLDPTEELRRLGGKH